MSDCPAPALAKATRIDLFNYRKPAMRIFHTTWFAFLPVLLRLVRDGAADGGGARGTGAHAGPDRQHHHRLGGDHYRGAAGDWLGVRPFRAAHHLYLAAAARRAAGHGHRIGAQLHLVPAVPAGDRRGRSQLRHHPIPHLGGIRTQRGGHGERHHGWLGQPRRRRHADGDAADLRPVRYPGIHRRHQLAPGDGGARHRHARCRGAVLAPDHRHGGRQLPRAARGPAHGERRPDERVIPAGGA